MGVYTKHYNKDTGEALLTDVWGERVGMLYGIMNDETCDIVIRNAAETCYNAIFNAADLEILCGRVTTNLVWSRDNIKVHKNEH